MRGQLKAASLRHHLPRSQQHRQTHSQHDWGRVLKFALKDSGKPAPVVPLRKRPHPQTLTGPPDPTEDAVFGRAGVGTGKGPSGAQPVLPASRGAPPGPRAACRSSFARGGSFSPAPSAVSSQSVLPGSVLVWQFPGASACFAKRLVWAHIAGGKGGARRKAYDRRRVADDLNGDRHARCRH